jgi:hypothetical protein
MVYLKDLFPIPFSSSYTPFHSALLYLSRQNSINSLQMTLSSSYLALRPIFLSIYSPRINYISKVSDWMLNFFFSIPQKLHFFSLIFLNSSKTTVLFFHLSLLHQILVSQHISSVSKSCFITFATVRDLWRIRNRPYYWSFHCLHYCYIALGHSKVEYSNSLNFRSSQINRLQLILNAAARVVTKTPNLQRMFPILKSLN